MAGEGETKKKGGIHIDFDKLFGKDAVPPPLQIVGPDDEDSDAQTENHDRGLSDKELLDAISRHEKMLKNYKLTDGGEKLRLRLRKLEAERNRRSRLKVNQTENHDRGLSDKELLDAISRHEKMLKNYKLTDGGEKLRLRLRKLEAERDRRSRLKVNQTENHDRGLSDKELLDAISRHEKMLKNYKLTDGRGKLRLRLRKLEAERDRRSRLKDDGKCKQMKTLPDDYM